ncbi:uncharacterized protein LOC144039189 [Vanacampus margaritifer]
MWWTGVLLALVSMATPARSQSGDGDYGSGFDMYPSVTATDAPSHPPADEPAEARSDPASAPPPPSPSPALQETCSVRFSTRGLSARALKAREEEVAYLQAIQHANKAVLENLAQYVGAELEEQSYEDVIRANLAGVREEHESCREVAGKAEEDLEKQLQGEVLDTLAGMQKIREESAAFEDMLRAASDIAGRLESATQALHAAFSKQLRDTIHA